MVSALVTIVYSVNFMLFADCYVTGGEGCFTLGFTNETTAGMLSYACYSFAGSAGYDGTGPYRYRARPGHL